jgi:hypothetical protein
MARQNVRLVAYAWGRQYVDDLLDFALAAALAPGNLPALAAFFECTAVIVTEEKLFDYVRAHPTIKKLKQICQIELVPLDDLVSDPWQYGITVAYALFRGFEDLGSAMTDTYILFLNADFILADRCYEKLIERIRSAERVHLAPSYCTVEEEMRPLLRRARNKNGGILAISAPDMAALILRRPHNTVRAKTINQPVFEFEYADQFYWKIDSHTLIGHQMPVALVGMRPERALTDLNTFWDWGIVYEFCPSKQLNVIGDSDDFLMMELRSKNRSINSIRLGRSSPKQISKRLTGHITQYQLDNAQFELRLHSRELPLGLAEARRQLRARVKEVLRHLPSMSDHRWHRQWIYHLRHYRWRLERKWICSRVERITSEIAVAESRLSKERELIDEYLSDEDRKQALQYLDAEYADNLQELRHQLARLENRLQAPIQAADWIFRRIAGAPWVYRLSRRRLRNWIKQAAEKQTLRILAVCQPYSLLFGLFEQIPGCHMHLTPESVINGSLQLLPQAGPRFEICIVELIGLGESHAKQLLRALTEHLSQPGTIFVHWHDRGSVPLEAVHSQIVPLTLDRAYNVRAYFAGSWASSYVTHALSQVRSTAGWRRLFSLARIPTLAVLAVFAEMIERTRRTHLTTMPKHCSSALFHIEIPSRETNAVEAGTASGLQEPKVVRAQPPTRKFEMAVHPMRRRSGRGHLLPDGKAIGKF